MKHLQNFKKFEKLSPETYKKAADQLRKSGQTKRAKEMDIHSKNLNNTSVIGRELSIVGKWKDKDYHKNHPIARKSTHTFEGTIKITGVKFDNTSLRLSYVLSTDDREYIKFIEDYYSNDTKILKFISKLKSTPSEIEKEGELSFHIKKPKDGFKGEIEYYEYNHGPNANIRFKDRKEANKLIDILNDIYSDNYRFRNAVISLSESDDGIRDLLNIRTLYY